MLEGLAWPIPWAIRPIIDAGLSSAGPYLSAHCRAMTDTGEIHYSSEVRDGHQPHVATPT